MWKREYLDKKQKDRNKEKRKGRRERERERERESKEEKIEKKNCTPPDSHKRRIHSRTAPTIYLLSCEEYLGRRAG